KVNYATTSLQSLTINSTQRKNRLFFCNGVILFTTELVSSSLELKQCVSIWWQLSLDLFSWISPEFCIYLVKRRTTVAEFQM
ncbi:MAG: hypothetical protein ABSE82_06955, partial [Nitrososphaerales archaeon]